MAHVPDQLRQLADRIAAEGEQRESIRALLSWFGAQRRGYWICKGIREALREVQLVTRPTFDSVYIDDSVTFAHEDPPVQAEAGDQPRSAADPIVTVDVDDLVPRIGMLPAANRRPIMVKRDDSLETAVTLMLLHDYSQLPVMQSDRNIDGFISWRTIGQARTRNARIPQSVRDCMSPAIVVLNWDETLFAATQHIIACDFVLIRGRDQAITGLITTSDIGQQFKDLSEAFLLIGEIENNVRRLLSGKFRLSELQACTNPSDTGRTVVTLTDLTFGEYLRLLERPERWTQLGLALDRGTFLGRMDEVRRMRNDVMHFHPDGISQDDVTILGETLRFLERL